MPATAEPVREEIHHALSPLQQGLLYHSLETGGPGVDLVQVEGELDEEIDPAAFTQAWNEMVERHDLLRSAFLWEAEAGPRRLVRSSVALPLETHRWPPLPDPEASRWFEEAVRREDRERPISPGRAPLWRLTLWRLGPARWRMFFTFHHLLLDLRALGLLLREAFAAYAARRGGGSAELPPVYPYNSYTEWLAAQPEDEAADFWRSRLRGLSADGLWPPPERTPPPAASAAAGFSLSSEISRRLEQRAAAARVTPNTLVQAAWALLLSRHGGAGEVCFGAVRACRHTPVPGAAAMIGPLINTVPVRARVDGEARLFPWLQEMRRQWVETRPFEHTPLARIGAWSGLAAGQPLFTTLVSFQDPAWDADLSGWGEGWAGRRFRVRSRPNCLLALDGSAGPSWRIDLLHDPRRFSAEEAGRLAGRYRRILEQVAELPPTARLAEVEWLAAEEAEKIRRWGATDAREEPAACVHHQVEEQAALHPGRLALADARRSLTYGDLDAEAGRLARRLQDLGAGPEGAVAVCLARSVDLAVAWLAVLKSGGAFVPIDPSYPRERQALLCRESGARWVIADQSTKDGLPAGGPALVAFASDAGDEEGPEVSAPPQAEPGNLAYVIFTSGSTGRPKGVQIEHQALSRLVDWHVRTYGIVPEDRASQVASPAFDAAVWEIWPYLCAGASVHFPDEETRVSPPRLVAWLAEQRISMSFLPTPLAEAAMDERWPAGVALRALLTGGDRLRRRPPEHFPCPLINHYGPTEGTVVATAGTVEPRAADGAEPSIGRPLGHVRTRVVDGDLRLVPIGVEGELLIGGAGLARGYRGQPELDRERFLPDPYLAGSRLYRTGDRVRWRGDGQIEFLGRLDDQVKINGYRIEPGEIESALARHPAVSRAAVVAKEDGAGRRLIGYLVPGSLGRASEAQLRDFLQKSLPGHLVPVGFVWLDKLPLSAHGKVDRRALAGRKEEVPGASAPESAAEKAVAGIWSRVLGGRPVGRQDNFFALGGHSLAAAQIIARLRAELGVEVGVRALFDHPTPAAFAAVLEQTPPIPGATPA